MANWKDDSMTMGARSVLRAELDGLPDFFVAAKDVQFRREFRTLASEDSFCDAWRGVSLPDCSQLFVIECSSVCFVSLLKSFPIKEVVQLPGTLFV